MTAEKTRVVVLDSDHLDSPVEDSDSNTEMLVRLLGAQGFDAVSGVELDEAALADAVIQSHALVTEVFRRDGARPFEQGVSALRTAVEMGVARVIFSSRHRDYVRQDRTVGPLFEQSEFLGQIELVRGVVDAINRAIETQATSP